MRSFYESPIESNPYDTSTGAARRSAGLPVGPTVAASAPGQIDGRDPYADNWVGQTTRSVAANLANDLTEGVSFLGRGLLGDTEGRQAAAERYLAGQEDARAMGPAIQSFEDAKAAGGDLGDYGASLGYMAAGLLPDVAMTATGIGLGGSAARLVARKVVTGSIADGIEATAGAAARRSMAGSVGRTQARAAATAAGGGPEAVSAAARVATAQANEAARKAAMGEAVKIAGRTPRVGIGADTAEEALTRGARAAIDSAGTWGGRAGGTAAAIPTLNGSANAEKAADADTTTADMWKLAAGTTAAAATQVIPIERFLSKFGTPARAAAAKNAERFLPKATKEALAQGAYEGTQEVVQQALQNGSHAWVEENWDAVASPKAFQQYLSSFLAGGILGGAMGAGGVGARSVGGAVGRGAGWARDKTSAGYQALREKIAKNAQAKRDRDGMRKQYAPGEAMGPEGTATGDLGSKFSEGVNAARGAASAAGSKARDVFNSVTDRFKQNEDDYSTADYMSETVDMLFDDSLTDRAKPVSELPDGKFLRHPAIQSFSQLGRTLAAFLGPDLDVLADNPQLPEWIKSAEKLFSNTPLSQTDETNVDALSDLIPQAVAEWRIAGGNYADVVESTRLSKARAAAEADADVRLTGPERFAESAQNANSNEGLPADAVTRTAALDENQDDQETFGEEAEGYAAETGGAKARSLVPPDPIDALTAMPRESADYETAKTKAQSYLLGGALESQADVDDPADRWPGGNAKRVIKENPTTDFFEKALARPGNVGISGFTMNNGQPRRRLVDLGSMMLFIKSKTGLKRRELLMETLNQLEVSGLELSYTVLRPGPVYRLGSDGKPSSDMIAMIKKEDVDALKGLPRVGQRPFKLRARRADLKPRSEKALKALSARARAKMRVDESDREDNEDEVAQVSFDQVMGGADRTEELAAGQRELPPAAVDPTGKANGSLVSTTSPIFDVKIRAPYAKLISATRKTIKAGVKSGKGGTRPLTPNERQFAVVKAGIEIGMAELNLLIDRGQISAKAANVQQAKIQAADGKYAMSLYKKATQGDFDSAGKVSETQTKGSDVVTSRAEAAQEIRDMAGKFYGTEFLNKDEVLEAIADIKKLAQNPSAAVRTWLKTRDNLKVSTAAGKGDGSAAKQAAARKQEKSVLAAGLKKLSSEDKDVLRAITFSRRLDELTDSLPSGDAMREAIEEGRVQTIADLRADNKKTYLQPGGSASSARDRAVVPKPLTKAEQAAETADFKAKKAAQEKAREAARKAGEPLLPKDKNDSPINELYTRASLPKAPSVDPKAPKVRMSAPAANARPAPSGKAPTDGTPKSPDTSPRETKPLRGVSNPPQGPLRTEAKESAKPPATTMDDVRAEAAKVKAIAAAEAKRVIRVLAKQMRDTTQRYMTRGEIRARGAMYTRWRAKQTERLQKEILISVVAINSVSPGSGLNSVRRVLAGEPTASLTPAQTATDAYVHPLVSSDEGIKALSFLMSVTQSKVGLWRLAASLVRAADAGLMSADQQAEMFARALAEFKALNAQSQLGSISDPTRPENGKAKPHRNWGWHDLIAYNFAKAGGGTADQLATSFLKYLEIKVPSTGAPMNSTDPIVANMLSLVAKSRFARNIKVVAETFITADIKGPHMKPTASGATVTISDKKVLERLFGPDAGAVGMDPIAIFVHETVHGMTALGEAADLQLSKDLDTLTKHVRREFDKKFGEGASNLIYGLSNTQEFLAESFSNAKFQGMLREIAPANTASFKTAWDQFKHLVLRLLGLPTTPTNFTALDEALTLGVALMRASAEAADAKKVFTKQFDDLGDGLDAAASTPSDGHDYAAETEMINAMAKAMGVTANLEVRSAGAQMKSKGGSYDRSTRVIEINSNLTGAERVEVLMHELGHHVVWDAVAKVVGWDAVKDLSLDKAFDVIAESNPKLYAELKADYAVYLAKHPPGSRKVDALAARKPLQRSRRAAADGTMNSDRVGDKTFAGAHGFHEWVADNIARALTTQKAPVSLIGKFFADIATKIRAAWNKLGKLREKYRPAKSVDKWVRNMFNAEAAAMQATTGANAPRKDVTRTVKAAVSTALVAQTADAPRREGDPNQYADPIGPSPAFVIEDIAGFKAAVRTMLTTDARQILQKALGSMRATMRMREALNELYKNDPAVRDQFLKELDSAKDGLESRVAVGYMLWQKGLLTTGPNSTSVLFGMSDDLLTFAGLAGNGFYAHRIFSDIADGTITAYHVKQRSYDVRRLEVKARGKAQANLEAVRAAYVKAMEPLSKVLDSQLQRMRDSGLPSMARLAGEIFRPSDTVPDEVEATAGRGNGMTPAIVNRTAAFLRKANSALESLSDADRAEVLKRMQEQRPVQMSDDPIDRAMASLQNLFTEAHAYMREAGIPVGKRKDFFPVVFDYTNPDAAIELQELYLQKEANGSYRYEKAIREFFAKASAASKAVAPADADAEFQEMVKNLVNGALSSAADGIQTPGLAPGFKGANFRVSQFIYDQGNEADIKAFAALQTKSPAEIFARYFDPMVKHAEFTRFFGGGKDNRDKLQALLDGMMQEGATPPQLKAAEDAVAAAVGAYGADGSPVLRMVSNGLADRFSGPGTKAFVQHMQAYQNLRLLPLSVLSSIVDPMGIAVRTGGDFGSAWEGFKYGIRGVFNGAANAEMLDALRMVSASEDVLLPAMAAGATFQGRETPMARKVNDFVFKYNGMQRLVLVTRFMALQAGHAFLLKHAERVRPGAGYTDAQVDTSRRYLAELGVSEADITEVITPSATGGAARSEVGLNDKTKEALSRFVNDAILRPHSQQVPLWYNDPYVGLLTQYKGFLYAIYDQIGGRIMREVNHGNVLVALPAMSYVPIVIIAELLREWIQYGIEGNPRREDWGPADYAWMGTQRTGLLGPKYDVISGVREDAAAGRAFGSSQLGPTAGQAINIKAALDGRRSKAQEIENALPFNPLWKRHVNPLSSDQPEVPAA